MIWYCQWSDSNLKHQAPPNKSAPQDHSGLVGVLSEVATHLQNVEVLRPVPAAQREADRETCSWEILPPTSQRVILAASAADGLTILSAPPPYIHRFIKSRNATELQAKCALTYSGKNIFLPTASFQALHQGHILAILEPNVSTGLYLVLTPTSSTGPANTHHIVMIFQVLIAMGHDRLSKDKAAELLDQCVHVISITQELCHSTRNFVRLTRDSLGMEGNLYKAMATWPCHIYCFEH